jgi:protein-S-isoprenylcysteine O-methyltransferase Ste14
LSDVPPDPFVSSAPAGAASPFADPRYGCEAERDSGHVIASRPRWPPSETQKPLTGWMGALTVLAAAVLLTHAHGSPEPGSLLEWLWNRRAPLIFAAIFAAMAAVEIFAYKIHRRNFDFSAARVIDSAAKKRIAARWLALLFCAFCACLLYIVLHHYSFHLWPYPESAPHAAFRSFLMAALPVLLLLSLPYFWLVERHARADGPVDEFLALAGCLKRAWRGLWRPDERADAGRAIRNPHARNLALGLLVKFFFVPFMIGGSLGACDNWQDKSQKLLSLWPAMSWETTGQIAANCWRLQITLLAFIFMLDMTVAVIGYVVSLRLFDTQITSAEPTFFGWAVALACYPPFNAVIMGQYLSGPTAGDFWRHEQVAARPSLAIACCAASVILMAVYTWATFSFGMRFSNLTNRGVICHGPYRWVRHPAYICKNSAWWLANLPILLAGWHVGLIHAAHLLLISGIYCLRAFTEERHLQREPHYREYCQQVRWRFIPKIW